MVGLDMSDDDIAALIVAGVKKIVLEENLKSTNVGLKNGRS